MRTITCRSTFLYGSNPAVVTGGEGVKTTENETDWPRFCYQPGPLPVVKLLVVPEWIIQLFSNQPEDVHSILLLSGKGIRI
jgi:hypothetical protein